MRFPFSFIRSGSLPAVPVVVSISPSAGTISGGDYVIIEVNDSTGATSAALDGVNLTNFVIIDGTHVAGKADTHAAGIVNVTVTNGSGTGTLVGGFTYDTVISAAFTYPRTVSYDGTHLWVGAQSQWSGLNADNDAHILQKVDPRLTNPAVIATVDLSTYSNGGEGIDGSNPAPVFPVKVKQVRSNGAYTYACLMSTQNLNDSSVSGFCVIIQNSTNTIVGHAKFLSGVTTDRSADCIAVTFDGAGNFFVAQRDGSFGTEPNIIHKFNITSTLAAYPSYGTPAASFTLTLDSTTMVEDLAYGAGYVWICYGANGNYQLDRMDPSTGAITSYVLIGGLAGFGMMSLTYAFGSVWAAGADGTTDQAILRFDPAVWPTIPTILTAPTHVFKQFTSGMQVAADSSTIWYTNACTPSAESSIAFRFSTGVGTEALIATISTGNTKLSTMAFDGTSMWVLSRAGSIQPGLMRISTGLGTEAVNYSIVNGGPGLYFYGATSWFYPADYVDPGVTVYAVPRATWPDHSGITLPDHSGVAIGYGNGRDLVCPYSSVMGDPPAVGGLPSVSGTNYLNFRALQNLVPLSEWAGGEDHHYFVVAVPSLIDDFGFPNEYQKIIGDTSSYTGLYVYRSGAGPYQYWARYIDYDTATRYAEVEITSLVDSVGAGRIVLQGKKTAGYTWVRAASDAWVQGAACGVTGASAMTRALQVGYIWGAYDNVNPCLLRAGATWRRALSSIESDAVATYGAII